MGSVSGSYGYHRNKHQISLASSRGGVLHNLVFRVRADRNRGLVGLAGFMIEPAPWQTERIAPTDRKIARFSKANCRFIAARIMWTVKVTLATGGVILVAWNGQKYTLGRTLARSSCFMRALSITVMPDMRMNALS